MVGASSQVLTHTFSISSGVLIKWTKCFEISEIDSTQVLTLLTWLDYMLLTKQYLLEHKLPKDVDNLNEDYTLAKKAYS